MCDVELRRRFWFHRSGVLFRRLDQAGFRGGRREMKSQSLRIRVRTVVNRQRCRRRQQTPLGFICAQKRSKNRGEIRQLYQWAVKSSRSQNEIESFSKVKSSRSFVVRMPPPPLILLVGLARLEPATRPL